MGRAVLNARTFVVATAGAAVDTVRSEGADDGHAAGNVHASLAGARRRWLSVACAEGDDGMTSCPVWDERQGKSWAGRGPEIADKVEAPVCPSSCASITSAWLRPSPCPGRFAGVVDITVLYRISPSQR